MFWPITDQHEKKLNYIRVPTRRKTAGALPPHPPTTTSHRLPFTLTPALQVSLLKHLNQNFNNFFPKKREKLFFKMILRFGNGLFQYFDHSFAAQKYRHSLPLRTCQRKKERLLFFTSHLCLGLVARGYISPHQHNITRIA